MDVSAQLQEVRAKLAQLDPMDRNNMAEIAHLKAQESELAKATSLGEEANKEIEERAQQQEQHINELMDFVVNLGLFESTVGEQPVSGLGINEYQERREQFNGILYLAIVEKQRELMNTHNDEMQQKVNTINELTIKCAGLEESLAKTVNDRDTLEDENITVTAENEKLKNENNELGRKNFELVRRVTELEGANSQLQSALDKASKPAAAPSKSLKEQIEEYKKAQASKWIKVKSKTKMDITGNQWRVVHLDDKIEVVNGIEQAKYRVATEDEIEEARFLAEQAAKDVEESVESDPTLVVPIPEPTFHISLEDETHDATAGLAGGELGGTVEDGTTEAPEHYTWEEDVVRRLSELEDRVKAIENGQKKGAA